MDIQRNSATAWLLAARPKTLTAAIIPVIAGTALALHDHALQPASACYACSLQE